MLGRSLWEFIHDLNVRQLYRHLVTKARSGHPLEFHYRCDSPTQRRVFLMRIAAVPEGRIEFFSRLESVEARPAVDLLNVQVPRSSAALRVCSWCQRIALGVDEWVDAEVAVECLGLLQAETLPALTHGICPTCYGQMMRLLEEKPAKR